MANNFRVEVHEYKGKLIVEPSGHKPSKIFIPTGKYRKDDWTIGSVLTRANKKTLFFSKEAVELMKEIPIGPDAVGDIDFWKCGKGKAFSWFGAIYRIMDPRDAQAARTFRLHDDAYTVIKNNPPHEAIEVIRRELTDYIYRRPYRLGTELKVRSGMIRHKGKAQWPCLVVAKTAKRMLEILNDELDERVSANELRNHWLGGGISAVSIEMEEEGVWVGQDEHGIKAYKKLWPKPPKPGPKPKSESEQLEEKIADLEAWIKNQK